MSIHKITLFSSLSIAVFEIYFLIFIFILGVHKISYKYGFNLSLRNC